MVDEANKRANRSNQQRTKDSTRDNLSDVNPVQAITQEGGMIDSESDESETFNELAVQEAPKERYKDLLSNVPEPLATDNPRITQALPEAQTGDPATSNETHDLLAAPMPKSDKAILWDKIAEAVAVNDKENADFFIRLYSQLSDLGPASKPDILRAKTSDAVTPLTTASSSKKSNDKTSIIFVRGSLPKHFDVGFTPYFDKNIKELRGPIPLTIFDKKWQEDAIQYHTNKRSQGDEKDGNYTGFEYPNEWTQTFAKWTSNHRNFHVTFRDMYNYPDFANWILEHKANVDRIISEDGFLVGFRYDLIIRQNAFSYQVETEQGTSAVDIPIFRKEVKREAWKVTRNLEELDYSDNPYAFGGPKFNFDPQTGKPKLPKGKYFEDHQVAVADTRYQQRGRGGFRQGRGGERFHLDHRYSDYGTHRDESYTQDHSSNFNKRPRDFHHNEDASYARFDAQPTRGGYSKDRGGSSRDRSFRGVSKLDTPKGKDKDNV
ncbi:hypothetical protein PGTUg99_003073 [Puccinia graminis f. sp. tritici]|uniref:Uncharacterized protein n=1 Tax=Puccinia graminis f. sp. tritici TaxID=56615 RepID=A0A5B0SBC3_PUCGR|nr:hypothetical protein PGTUg99_003073 [Puccinia graminis f. sp. tritici]